MVSIGVSHGSNVSLLKYVIFINESPLSSVMCADDTSLIVCDSDIVGAAIFGHCWNDRSTRVI